MHVYIVSDLRFFSILWAEARIWSDVKAWELE